MKFLKQIIMTNLILSAYTMAAMEDSAPKLDTTQHTFYNAAKTKIAQFQGKTLPVNEQTTFVNATKAKVQQFNDFINAQHAKIVDFQLASPEITEQQASTASLPLAVSSVQAPVDLNPTQSAEPETPAISAEDLDAVLNAISALSRATRAHTQNQTEKNLRAKIAATSAIQNLSIDPAQINPTDGLIPEATILTSPAEAQPSMRKANQSRQAYNQAQINLAVAVRQLDTAGKAFKATSQIALSARTDAQNTTPADEAIFKAFDQAYKTAIQQKKTAESALQTTFNQLQKSQETA